MDRKMGAEIVNLRRVRKARGRADRAQAAEANRAKHGVAKEVRDLARARADKDAKTVEAHRLEDEE
jgi:uncharacterized protein DUF4169